MLTQRSNLRVAHIIDSLDTGGAEMMAVNLVNGLLSQHDVEVHLIVARGHGPLGKKVAQGVHVLNLGKRHAFDIKASLKLLKYCRLHSINMLHAHSTSIFLAWQVNMFLRAKFVWHDHYGLPLHQSGKRPYTYKPFLRFVNCVFVVNHALKELHLRLLPKLEGRVFYVPNFVQDVSLQTKHEVRLYPKLILVAANRPQKAWHLALRAFHICLQFVPNLQFTIVGSKGTGQEWSKIAALVAELKLGGKVHFAGEDQHVFSHLLNADLALLSSISEGLPLALLEYGMAALPVVSTSVGDCALVLGNGEFGWLVPPNDAQALADALLYILHHRKEGIEKGRLLHQHVKDHYSENVVISKVVAHYKNLLQPA